MKSKGPQPEQFAKNGSEHGEQVAIFCKAAQNFKQYPELRLMFAVPNGGFRDKITGARLKAEGVKSGVPDIFLPVARGQWHGLFVELKRGAEKGKPKGRASDDQKEFIAALQVQGYGAVVCVGWQEAWNVIEQYLNYK